MPASSPRIATPLSLPSGQVLKNRLVKSALSEQLADRRHNPDVRLQCLYRQWARGGLGLAISGNIMVDRRHLGEPGNVVLDEESDLSAFRAWVDAATENGTAFWAQLNHPGKQSPVLVNARPVAPSALAFDSAIKLSFRRPQALDEQGIEDIIARFARSAGLARLVGFQGVQIHAAHGYLISQFLSPIHNQRQDRWGGSLENRMRFPLAIYQAIRAEVGPDFPVAIKLNSADFQRGGFSEDESMQVVEALAEAGIDLIEISGGTYESAAMMGVKSSTREREAYFLQYAEELRQRCRVPLLVTGGFRSAKGMNQALAEDATDLIGLGRPMAVAPELPAQLLADADHRIEMPQISTGIRAIDKAGLLDITWYQLQLARMARNHAPNPALNPWRSLLMTGRELGWNTFLIKRG